MKKKMMKNKGVNMWLICSGCKKHLPLYKFSLKRTNKSNLWLSYYCKGCHAAYKKNNRGVYKKRPKRRQYVKKESIEPKKTKGWDDREVLQFMNVKMSDTIPIGHDNFKNLTVAIDEADYDKMNLIRENYGKMSYSAIARLGLRYLFHTMKL